MTIDFTQPVPGAAAKSERVGPAGPYGAYSDGPTAGSSDSPGNEKPAQPRVSGGDRVRAAAAVLAAPPLKMLMLGLNHLLRQQGWARHKLKMFRGRELLLAVEPTSPLAALAVPVQLRISEDGYLEPCTPADEIEVPIVTLWLRPSADMLAASISGKGIQAWAPFLRVEGDVMLAGVLAELAQHLRWDAEDDLSRVVGDVAAHRLTSFAGTMLDRLSGLRRRFEHTALEFLTAEDRQLVSGAALAARGEELTALRSRTDQLEARVRYLQGRQRALLVSDAPPPAGEFRSD